MLPNICVMMFPSPRSPVEYRRTPPTLYALIMLPLGTYFRASPSRKFTPSVEEQNNWEHLVFNKGSTHELLGRYGLHLNWLVTRGQVRFGRWFRNVWASVLSPCPIYPPPFPLPRCCAWLISAC